MSKSPAVLKSTALTLSDFSAEFRIGRTKAYELIKSGELRVARIGRRTLITRESAEALIEKNLAPAKAVS